MTESWHEEIRSSRTTPVTPEFFIWNQRGLVEPSQDRYLEVPVSSVAYDHCCLVFDEQIKLVMGLSSLGHS